jgi:HSP20 family protein
MTFYIRPYAHRRLGRRWGAPMAADYENQGYALAVNVQEEEDAYVLTAIVPGLRSEDLSIQVIEDVVRIEGEYRPAEGEHLLRELPFGSFKRTLRLPAPLDPNKAEASIENGILTLRLPKAESARPKVIKVVSK